MKLAKGKILMADQVLDISTLIERPKIAIDGKFYKIRSPEELSVIDHHRMESQGRRMVELTALPKLEPIEENELKKLLHAISDFIMVDVPKSVRKKLTDAQRASVSEVFTALPLRKHMMAMIGEATAQAVKAAEAKPKSTGGKRRRASKGSTAGRRDGGSTKRPSRSSGRT